MNEALKQRILSLANYVLEAPQQRLYVGSLHLYTELDDNTDDGEPSIAKTTCFEDVDGGLESHWEINFSGDEITYFGHMPNKEANGAFSEDDAKERVTPFLDAAGL